MSRAMARLGQAPSVTEATRSGSRVAIGLDSGHFSGAASLQSPATPQGILSAERLPLLSQSGFVRRGKSGDPLVFGKYGCLELPGDLWVHPRPRYQVRCQQARVRCALSKPVHGRLVVSRRTTVAYKLFRTPSWFVRRAVLDERISTVLRAAEDGQHLSGKVYDPSGGHQVQSPLRPHGELLAVLPGFSNLGYGGVPTGPRQHDSGLSVPSFQGFQPLDAGSGDLSSKQNLWGQFTVKLFASRLDHQLPRFFRWRPDPLRFSRIGVRRGDMRSHYSRLSRY